MSSLDSKRILVILEQWQVDDGKYAISKAIGRLSQVLFVAFFQQNDEINQSACDLAKGVAQEGGVFCAGSICQTARLYAEGAGKERIQKRFEEQIAIFLKNDMDLLIAEVSKKQRK